MRNQIKRMALFLCLALVLTGCKSAPQEAPAQALARSGRYVESEIKLPLPQGCAQQMVLGLKADESGITALTCAYTETNGVASARYFLHTVGEDGAAVTREQTWLNELAPTGGNEMRAAFGRDGALYMSYGDYDQAGDAQSHILAGDGQQGAELAGEGISALGTATGFSLLGDGNIAVCSYYGGELLLLDGQGGQLADLGADAGSRVDACAAGGNFVASAMIEAGKVRVQDTKSGKIAEYDFAFGPSGAPLLSVLEDGTVFLCDEGGVYRSGADSTLWEKVVEGATSALGLPGFYASAISVYGRENPDIVVANQEKVLRYRYDETVGVPDKTLEVFSLTSNETVRQAVVAFSRARSDVRVTYTVAMEGEGGGTAQDYIKALNTQLLAGTGPDVLILDGLPIDSYVEKGVLADMAQTLSGTEETLANISASLSRDGALYAAPTGFTVPLCIAKPDARDAFAGLSSLAEAAEAADPPLLAGSAFSYKVLSHYLLQYYYGAFALGDMDSLTEALTSARRLALAIGCTDRLGDGWDVLKDIPQDELYSEFLHYVCAPQIVPCLEGRAQAILSQPVHSIPSAIEQMAAARQLGAEIADVGGQFIPVGMAGVNAASPEPEAARAFVQTLFSYEAQGGNPYASQIPVNARAFAEMIADENKSISTSLLLNGGEEWEVFWPEEAQREAFADLVSHLDAPILRDEALTDRLFPLVADCVSGLSAPEDAAGQIFSLLSTYLSE